MALEFAQTYHGYAGSIPSDKFNIGNTDPVTIKFSADLNGQFYLDDDVTEMTVSIDGAVEQLSFTVFERGTMTSEVVGLGDFEYVIIDVGGQLYMFLHDGFAGSMDTSPFVGGNHNPLDPTPYCFVRGTNILTADGEINIENIQVGCVVPTRDNGLQTISWIGKRAIANDSNTHHTPIRISANALGNGVPKRDLLVSPQHRVLLTDWRADLLFGEPEVLIAAKHLVNDDTIRVAADLEEFEYFHILFDSHQTIFSEGLPTESFHPGDMAMNSLSEASRNEVLELFPELADGVENYGPAAHRSLKSFEAKALQRA